MSYVMQFPKSSNFSNPDCCQTAAGLSKQLLLTHVVRGLAKKSELVLNPEPYPESLM